MPTNKVLIAVAWPYVNADSLHLGHIAGAYLGADIFRRYNVLQGREVLMVSGSDMHGTPVSVKALSAGKDPKDFAFSNHKIFVSQLKALGFEYSNYTNTHRKLHFKVVNTIGKFLYKQGFLKPGKTKMFFDTKLNKVLPDRYVEGTCKYCGYYPARGDQCDGCGRILDITDLKGPKSKLSGTTPTITEVTNLYLDLPKFKDKILDYVKNSTHWRLHVKEMTLGFLKEGLKARPVTRNIQWGIPVDIDGYQDQVWYVWFEAVIGYLFASIEWSAFLGNPPADYVGIYNGKPKSKNEWQEYWHDPEVKHYYFLGKDNIPFHSIIWPIQLMMFNTRIKVGDAPLLPYETDAKELNLPYNVVANNYLLLNDAKFSKSTGNFISVADLLKDYTQDQIRYAIARLLPENKDANFTMDRFKELINNELVATIANLYYRVYSFVLKNYGESVLKQKIDENFVKELKNKLEQVWQSFEAVQLTKALDLALGIAKFGNTHFNEGAPWKDPQSKESQRYVQETLMILNTLSLALWPFVPSLVGKILNWFKDSSDIRNLDITKVYKVAKVERLVEKV